MDTIEAAKRVFDIEIEALIKTRDSLEDAFVEILKLITTCEGKVIITGMGKPGHIAKKMAATFSSLGTPSFYLHPAEALHGDLGMVNDKDVVIAISYSGESEEITRILPNIKAIGAKIIAISGNVNSTLVKYSDVAQIFPKFDEACYMNLAPTSSTTVTLAYGDALAVVASSKYGFNESNYGLFHPAGSLGKKLFLKVSDVMAKEDDNAVVHISDTLQKAIVEMSKKTVGMVTIVDNEGKIAGVITDGDLRRQLQKGVNVYDLEVDEVMAKSPIFIHDNIMAVEALQLFKEKKITSMPVVDDNGVAVGTVCLQSVLKAGIVL